MDLIINLAPIGMIPTRKMTPHVPVTVEEIVEDVHEAWEIGITMVHLHARDEESGEPTYRADVYARIIEGIRRFTRDLVVCVSTSGRTFRELEQRAAPLSLDGDCKPDMASLTLSSLNFNKIASINAPDTIMKLASKMLEKNIKPELEIFDVGMVNYAHYLIKKGLLTPPFYCNVLLGNIACSQAKPLHLGLILEELPENRMVTLGGVGDFQHPMNVVGLVWADGVRVGLEDNVYFDEERTKLATNADLVRRVADHARNLGKRFAAPSELRERLGLSPMRA